MENNESVVLVVRPDVQLGHLDVLLRSCAHFASHLADDLLKNLALLYGVPAGASHDHWYCMCTRELSRAGPMHSTTPLDRVLAALRVLGRECWPARLLESAIHMTRRESATPYVMQLLLAWVPRAATDAWPDAKKAWREGAAPMVFAESAYPAWVDVAPLADESRVCASPKDKLDASLGALEDRLGAEVTIAELPAEDAARQFMAPPPCVGAREWGVLEQFRLSMPHDSEWEATVEAQSKLYFRVYNAVQRIRTTQPDGRLRHRANFALRVPRLRREIEDALEAYYRALANDFAAAARAPPAPEGEQ